jgi:hypothetical protein
MKQCTDPTFMGTVIHVSVEGHTIALPPLVSAKERTDGTVDFVTDDGTFTAEFTDPRIKSCFVRGCRTLGRLAIC